MTTKLKQILLKETGLLSIPQSDYDLFLIAQANTITYRQLAAAALHGATQTSGRLSLKKLEKEGYLSGREIPGNVRMKYYLLTAKGRKRIELLFGSAFLNKMDFDLERRPPFSQQQLPHRLHTGDLYFTYLANPFLDHLPIWKLEAPYKEPKGILAPPRCDGLLKTAYGTYFIEQDNCTQGENAIGNKLEQYMSADCFLGNGVFNHTLIFTLYAEAKERPLRTPPYSVYRILLKATRVWNSLEDELGCRLSFTTFCLQFEGNSSPSLLHLSKNDRCILKNLCFRYPDLSLEELRQLKQTYLYDSSLEEDRHMEQDALFQKRLRRRFYPLLENKDNATLQFRLLKGMYLFVLPNHRLDCYLPFALQEEYHFKDFLHRLLFCMGLNDLEAWKYHPSLSFRDKNGQEYTFRNTFSSESGIRIAAEDIAHDLGGRMRVSHYLKSHVGRQKTLFVLFVASREDAALFLDELGHILFRPENKDTDLCFLDKSLSLYREPASHAAYFCRQTKESVLWLPAMLDYDAFLAELHLTERQV